MTVPLWTHHPSDFPVDDPDLVIDHTMGQYWRESMGPGFRYREVLPMLIARIGTDQFLWCCTVRGQFVRTTEDVDLVEWELIVPDSRIVFFQPGVWNELVWSKSDDWTNLFIDEPVTSGCEHVEAIVRTPLDPDWVTCHGPLPVQYPRQPATRTAETGA